MSELKEKPNVKAGDDAVDYRWFNFDDLPDMAFDHKDILNQFLDETSFSEKVDQKRARPETLSEKVDQKRATPETLFPENRPPGGLK